MTNEEINAISKFASELYVRQSSLRLGQSVWNVFEEMHPDKANLIRGTEFDPFYDDNKLDSFYKKLLEL